MTLQIGTSFCRLAAVLVVGTSLLGCAEHPHAESVAATAPPLLIGMGQELCRESQRGMLESMLSHWTIACDNRAGNPGQECTDTAATTRRNVAYYVSSLVRIPVLEDLYVEMGGVERRAQLSIFWGNPREAVLEVFFELDEDNFPMFRALDVEAWSAHEASTIDVLCRDDEPSVG